MCCSGNILLFRLLLLLLFCFGSVYKFDVITEQYSSMAIFLYIIIFHIALPVINYCFPEQKLNELEFIKLLF